MQLCTWPTLGRRLRKRAERCERSGQGWIEGVRRLCLNSKEALFSELLWVIVLYESIWGVLVLDTLRMISAADVEIRRLLCRSTALGRRRKRHLGAYYMKDLGKERSGKVPIDNTIGKPCNLHRTWIELYSLVVWKGKLSKSCTYRALGVTASSGYKTPRKSVKSVVDRRNSSTFYKTQSVNDSVW